MTIRRPLTLLAAASTAVAKPPPFAATHSPRGDYSGGKGIKWGECDFEAALPIECGSLEVPLDYTDPDAGTLDLSLSKLAAVEGESKGSILMNFGGPGFEGVETLGKTGPQLLNLTGGQHDLISFDPRGVAKTIPFECYETPEERELGSFKYRLEDILSDSNDVAANELWANAGAFANFCGEAQNETGELIGTAFVARDMMQIVDALDEDGLLRYWGLSYGSALGATTAAMFPDRMDRVLLDGVVNSIFYNHGFGLDADQTNGADAAWTALLEECIAAGDKCGISHLNETAAELEETLSQVAENFRTNPVTVGDTIITYPDVITLYYTLVKTPNDLAAGTAMLNSLVTGEDLAAVAEYFETLTSGIAAGNEGVFGIQCSDTTARSSDIEGVKEEMEYALQSSKLFGVIQHVQAMTCAQWPFEAKERYEGDFKVETPNPVMFIGNTYDAATDVGSAYKMSELFSGSVVVEQKGYGHGSIAQESACTAKAIRDFFVDGVTPDGNIECEVDEPLFPEQSETEGETGGETGGETDGETDGETEE